MNLKKMVKTYTWLTSGPQTAVASDLPEHAVRTLCRSFSAMCITPKDTCEISRDNAVKSLKRSLFQTPDVTQLEEDFASYGAHFITVYSRDLTMS
jgi:hypothetical protein